MEQDTIKLLRECDAGVKMGVASIDDVLDYVSDSALKEKLTECKAKHEVLKEEIQKLLSASHDEGKDPNPMAKSMSWMKTNVKLALNESDHTIADLMSDGCAMGSKSLCRYLNQYKAANQQSRDIARRLIGLEDQLLVELRGYL